MPVSFITTVRVTDERRARNLRYTLDWYQRQCDWEWVIVEQDAAPRLDELPLPEGLKRLFVLNPGPFNKAWGFNVGVRAARGDLLFFCDADLLVPASALETATSLCTRRVLAVNPYETLADLGRTESDALLAGDEPPRFDRNDASDRRGERERICFCGGAFMMRRSLHQHMGGFDERYLGWGGEDDAMSLRLGRTTAEVAVVQGRMALHLWHARETATTFGNPHYRTNLERLDALRALPDNEFRFMRDVQRQLMGYPGKYERELRRGDDASLPNA
ncbi:glycosyltransferase family A protein [uncultured Thiocystis sp.]|jgi:glycosyltransferase involved in cell wall biosynthesis|uniref:glycosyltransferase family A protein n=1 Tax=uncultured Thiocystis sp. TaxID=1202134 RepID=UPI0025FAF886|nr:glycosyltransferase family A protein [uncultured Thiocystis sp.]